MNSFLKGIESKGHLEDTALILFSDHGAKRRHLQFFPFGGGEDNKKEPLLPFLSIVLPKKMKNFEEIQSNLRDYENKIVTAYDLELMLLALINEKSKTNTKGRNILKKSEDNFQCSNFNIKKKNCQCQEYI